ncbi:MAG: topoisomerase DNA-binding C4 zinc finger domain-containing protein [Chromatiales bacterium]|nr:topoisomerase DNA-binding C4 zinc finger domain-containing protein [Chromatiales bacterium]
MEDDLDAISRGEKEWQPLLKDFWDDFQAQVKEKESVERPGTEILEEACPKCGKKLSKRLGRNGYFIGCTGYPECDYTRNVDEDAATAATSRRSSRAACARSANSALVIKRGRYGKFIGCSGYPNCKHMEPLEKPADTGVECPECKQATMLKRKSRYGKIFYSCARYPDCKYAVWNLPLKEPCPKCGWPILTHQDHQASRHREGLPGQGVRLRRTLRGRGARHRVAGGTGLKSEPETKNAAVAACFCLARIDLPQS